MTLACPIASAQVECFIGDLVVTAFCCNAAQSGGYPVKDSAQSMHSARSSDKDGGGLRSSGSGTTVRSVLDTLTSGKRISGQVRARPSLDPALGTPGAVNLQPGIALTDNTC